MATKVNMIAKLRDLKTAQALTELAHPEFSMIYGTPFGLPVDCFGSEIYVNFIFDENGFAIIADQNGVIKIHPVLIEYFRMQQEDVKQ